VKSEHYLPCFIIHNVQEQKLFDTWNLFFALITLHILLFGDEAQDAIYAYISLRANIHKGMFLFIAKMYSYNKQ
jgi:hypothetical protein